MSYYRTRNSRPKSYSSKNYGAEIAAQHIQEANEFSHEVGGTDKDVKAYFFSIDAKKKEEILSLYGKQYGAVPEAYARDTWSLWATGRRKMSGMVAKRLFALLPDHMPVAAKLQMVENLWRHCSPSSSNTLQIDSRSQKDESLILKVRQHFEDKLHHEIPDNFTRRFVWLAGDDSRVKQQLLNHFRKLELGIVSQNVEPKLEVLRKHLSENKSIYISGNHTITIGKHSLVLKFDNSEAIAEKNRADEALQRIARDEKNAEFAGKIKELFIVITLIIISAIIVLAIIS